MFESWQARLHTIIDILEASDVNEIEVCCFGRKYRVTKSAPVENSLVSAPASQMVQTVLPVDNRPSVPEPAPISENVEIYNQYYQIYRDLYPALKPQFDQVTQVVAQQSSDN